MSESEEGTTSESEEGVSERYSTSEEVIYSEEEEIPPVKRRTQSAKPPYHIEKRLVIDNDTIDLSARQLKELTEKEDINVVVFRLDRYDLSNAKDTLKLERYLKPEIDKYYGLHYPDFIDDFSAYLDQFRGEVKKFPLSFLDFVYYVYKTGREVRGFKIEKVGNDIRLDDSTITINPVAINKLSRPWDIRKYLFRLLKKEEESWVFSRKNSSISVKYLHRIDIDYLPCLKKINVYLEPFEQSKKGMKFSYHDLVLDKIQKIDSVVIYYTGVDVISDRIAYKQLVIYPQQYWDEVILPDLHIIEALETGRWKKSQASDIFKSYGVKTVEDLRKKFMEKVVDISSYPDW